MTSNIKAPSPFGKKAANAQTTVSDAIVRQQTLQTQSHQVPATVPKGNGGVFASTRQEVVGARKIALPVSDKDIEKLGADLPTRISATVNNITAKVTTAKFAELGDLLAELSSNTELLDPNNYGKAKGVMGWFKNAVVDVRKLMIKNLQTASQSFDALEAKMTEQIQIHTQWKRDLAAMALENEQNYYAICQDIRVADQWVEAIKQVLDNQPAIDPASETAMMQANMVREAQTTLNRCSRKADTFRRTRVLTENISPKIMAQTAASDDIINTYTDLITQVIPIVKMEFALYLQALEVKKDSAFQENVKGISEKAIVSSAGTAAESMVASAQTANSALISNEALNQTRNLILGAVTQVRNIEVQAQQQRVADAQMMVDSQATYLQELQKQGAV
ncbi:Toxic anion resistance protein (TelA) [compost metagenome]